MVETTTLLSLLQFVALAAPAIAILMQVTREMEASDFVFHLLTSSLILIIFGGLIITYLIFTTINKPMLSIGILLIFGSLVVIAGALAFTTIAEALTSQPEMSMSDLPDYALATLKNIAPRLLSLGLISIFYVIAVLLTRNIVNQYLNYGIFSGDAITPTIFFWIIASLLGVQSVIKLLENDVLPGGEFEEVVIGTLTIVFTWIFGYATFTVIPF